MTTEGQKERRYGFLIMAACVAFALFMVITIANAAPPPYSVLPTEITFTWERPTERENGDTMPVEELQGYIITVANKKGDGAAMETPVQGGHIERYEVTYPATVSRQDALDDGKMELIAHIVAYDIEGRSSRPSNEVTKSISIPQGIMEDFLGSPSRPGAAREFNFIIKPLVTIIDAPSK